MTASIRTLFAVAMLAIAGRAAPADDRMPNILFLFTDDQRADTVGALGNPAIRTPNLDRIARSGRVFRNAYCMGGDVGAVCLPSRTMLLSGRSLFRLKPMPADAPSLPRAFNAAGYVTYHHGKRGNTPLAIQKDFQINKHLRNDQDERNSGHPGREVADDAVAFLTGRPKDRPFLMYLAFGNPHDPRVADPADRSTYVDANIPLPTNYRPIHPFDNGEMWVRDEALLPWPRTPEAVRKELADYYAVITGLDREIGRILEALEASGEAGRTIVVFSSDQGLAMGSHGLMGKQNLYEDGMRVPLAIQGPGIAPGTSDAFVYLLDLFPTLCDLAGIPSPSGIDGRSFAGVVRGADTNHRDAIFLSYRGVQRAVRIGDWKLIRYPEIHRNQVFHLKDDPHETTDLAADPARAARIEEMTARLRAEQSAWGDTLPLSAAVRAPDAVDVSKRNRR